ncbi:MAG: heavy metal translocating P-type ATPase [Candidatus Zixiibacteriota bacterium]
MTTNKTASATLTIGGMHCASCASGIEQGLTSLPGVNDTQVNFAMGSAAVRFRPEMVSVEEVLREIERLGYVAHERGHDDLLNFEEEARVSRQKFIIAALLTAPIFALNILGGSNYLSDLSDVWRWGNLEWTPYYLVALLAGAVLSFAGRGIFRDAWEQTRRRRANMNSLIALGSGVAFLFSLWNLLSHSLGLAALASDLYFETASVIITLVLLGRYLESRAGGKAKQAIVGLMNLRPGKATAIINGTPVEIESASAQPGMTLLVRPGERVAADGVITSSEPSLDESMLTGESIPVEKRLGDKVIGGSLNGPRAFEMEVTASGEDSYLAGVIRIVSDAQNTRAPVQAVADRVAAVFVPVVLLISAITFTAWFFFGGENSAQMLYVAPIAVLIIACPCALGLATPTAVLAGAGAGARHGILFKGGDTVERLVKTDTVVFDKTGTLTYGRPEVAAIHPAPGVTELELLAPAAALECASTHPLAEGIMREIDSRTIQFTRATEIEARSGFGMRGKIDQRVALVGSETALKNEGVDLSEIAERAAEEMQRGRTLVFIAVAGVALGFVALADRVRPEASQVITDLKEEGIKTFMFTGDNRRTAQTTARALGIDHVEAEILPEQKSELVRALSRVGENVIMVGDGINDAPALAEADIGVALGAGADIAKQSADIVLVKADLRALQDAREVARRTFRIIKQNLFWAFIYNALAIPLAAGVFYPAFGRALSPEIGALTMALSSVLVVANSTRLSRLKPSAADSGENSDVEP